MKSRLSKHLYSTTLVAALLAGNAHLAMAAPAVVAAAEQTQTAPLSLHGAIEQALKTSIDLELLQIDYEVTEYETLYTLREKAAIRLENVNTLDDAKKKYEDAAKARKDLALSEVTLKTTKNNLQLQVQKAYFEVSSLEEKIKLQKQSIQRQYWSESDEAKEKLSALETSYKQALAKLNDLLNEKKDKSWHLETRELSAPLVDNLEEAKAQAYKKRPDMMKAVAEKDFAEVKVNYTKDYTPISTYKGKVAVKQLRKSALVLERLKQKVAQEVADSYEKVAAAKKTLDESVLAQNEAAKQYQQALSDYTSQKAVLKDLIEKEASLFAAETKASESLYQYNLAVSTLGQSIGF